MTNTLTTALHEAGREMTRAFAHVVRPETEAGQAKAYLEARDRHSLAIARLAVVAGLEQGQGNGDTLVDLLRAADAECSVMTAAYLDVCRAADRDWTIRFLGARDRHQAALVAALQEGTK